MSEISGTKELAREYEDDLRYLIYRTSSGEYDSVLESFYVLADLYCLIERLEKLDGCRVDVPSPAVVSNIKILERLNVDPAERRHLRDFLGYIEHVKGRKFEELIDAHIKAASGPNHEGQNYNSAALAANQ